MLFTIIISLLVFILLTSSIIFFPTIKIRRVRIATYWLIALIGAIILILFKSVPIEYVIDNLTADNAINPIKILILFLSMTFICHASFLFCPTFCPTFGGGTTQIGTKRDDKC